MFLWPFYLRWSSNRLFCTCSQICGDYLLSKMDSQSAISYRNFANCMRDGRLLSKIDSYIQEHLLDVSEQEDFLKLPRLKVSWPLPFQVMHYSLLRSCAKYTFSFGLVYSWRWFWRITWPCLVMASCTPRWLAGCNAACGKIANPWSDWWRRWALRSTVSSSLHFPPFFPLVIHPIQRFNRSHQPS